MKLKKIKNKIIKIYKQVEQFATDFYIKILQEKYEGICFSGAIGVGVYDNGDYYLFGSIPNFIIDKERLLPGASARHTAKGSLLLQLGPMPPQHGVPHQLVLVPLLSFYIKLTKEQRNNFIDQWTRTITTYDNIPYCEFRTMR
jgi:hypothetical protein